MPNTATQRAPQFFEIPAGAKPTMCKGSTCNRTFYWVRLPNGVAIPVDVDVPGGVKPSEHANDPTQESLFATEKVEHHDGRGVRHHSVCPDVDEFRRAPR
jgi:hypothetical protein